LKLNSVDNPWLEDVHDWLLQLVELHKVNKKVLEQVRKRKVRKSHLLQEYGRLVKDVNKRYRVRGTYLLALKKI